MPDQPSFEGVTRFLQEMLTQPGRFFNGTKVFPGKLVYLAAPSGFTSNLFVNFWTLYTRHDGFEKSNSFELCICVVQTFRHQIYLYVHKILTFFFMVEISVFKLSFGGFDRNC